MTGPICGTISDVPRRQWEKITPSVPLKPSQILPAKTGNQPDWDGFSGTEGVLFFKHSVGK